MTWVETVFGKWVVKYKWWIIMATIACVLISASGVRLLTFNNDMRVFFSKKNPQLQALEERYGGLLYISSGTTPLPKA